MIDLTPLLEGVITVLSVIMSSFVIPALKSRERDTKLDEIVRWTKIAVKAAEQIIGDEKGAQKKQYVVNFLKSKGFAFDDALIEAAVFDMVNDGLEALTVVNNV